MAVIDIRNISKRFADVQAVKNISFSLHGGEILGLLGPNGAGKTTTIRMILDIFRPDSGTVSILGGPMAERKKELIGYLPEERGLYQDITLEKCLTYLASIKGMQKSTILTRLPEYLERFELSSYRSKLVKELSKGMQQKAQLIATFIHKPKLVIVDEPFSALDPVNTQIVKKLLFEERDRGTAIMMSTHQMSQAEEMCGRILLINKGEIVLEGDLGDLRNRFARPEVVLRAEGDLPEKIDGVKLVQAENHHQRLFLESGSSPQVVLAALIKRGVKVSQFEIAVPSLNEIFIEVISNGKSEK